jgi:hypothetical protein
MSDHYHDPKYMEAREKLGNAVREFIHDTHPENPLLMGATVVYETTTFDEAGEQMYSTGHVVLDPSSLAHALGLLIAGQDRLTRYINDRYRPYGEED